MNTVREVIAYETIMSLQKCTNWDDIDAHDSFITI